MDNNIGTILKLKRLEKGIKQEQLCEGICTPSYLSRIENNKLTANEEIYRLLFERLETDYEEILSSSNEIDKRIENWYLELLRNGNSKEVVSNLEEMSSIAGGDISIKFSLVYCRYKLMNGDINSIEDTIQNLDKVIDKSYNRNFFIYSNLLLLYNYKLGDYSKAVNSAAKLMEIRGFELLASDFEMGVFYFNVALTYNKLHSYEKGELYVKRALSIFKDIYELDRAMNCHIVLGTSYINMGEWNDAIYTYNLAKNLLTYLPQSTHNQYLKMLRNNMGNMYEYQGMYQEAINYYLQSLEVSEGEYEDITIINLIRCYYNLEKYEEAKKWISKSTTLKRKPAQTTNMQYKIFEVLLEDNLTIDMVAEIQKSSIEFFLSVKNRRLVKRYSELFGRLYESFSMYKSASSMYKLAAENNL